MKDILTKVIDSLAPIQSKRIRGKPSPWLSSEIKMGMNSRDKLLRKYRKTKFNTDFQAYKSLRNKVNSLIKSAKSQYHKFLLEQNANNPDKFWDTIKQIYPNKPLNSMPAVFNDGTKSVTDLKEISNLFSMFFYDVIRVMKDKAFSIRDCVWGVTTELLGGTDCCFQFNMVTVTEIETCLRSLKRKKSTGLDNISPFVLKDCSRFIAPPLAHLINLSFATGVYPTEWKTSKVIPIYKKAHWSDLQNYRPISIIPAISKVIEKVVHCPLLSYLESNGLLHDNQFGFRRGRSTEQATILFTDSVRRAVDSKKVVGAVFLDLSKAFDTIGQSKLIAKLSAYGIINIEREWFIDYLFHRSQYVQYKNTLSDKKPVLSGVPQGSISGPLLFVMYFNDLAKCVQHSSIIKYADDTKIFASDKNISDTQYKLTCDLALTMN